MEKILYDRLEILLRTIEAALLKTKCNGRFVKNKRYQETGKEYFTIVQMIVKDEGYKYFAARTTFDAWPCPPNPPSAPQTHTHQQKGHCLPNDFSPSHLQLTQPYFQFPSRQMHKFSYHTTAQKEKKKKSISPEMSHKPNSTVPILNKSKKSIQTQGITWMSWLQEPFY